MRRWKLYFRYDHLPPHLQAISKPFGEAAEAIMGMNGEAGVKISECLRVMVTGVVDEHEALVARFEINDALIWLGSGTDMSLRHLLRAKDSAVRAHLPDPQ